MARVELAKGGIEILPSGNVYEFSTRCRQLTPEIYTYECCDLSLATPAAQKLANGVQECFIRDGWNFTALLAGDKDIAIVFVNPLRTATSLKCPEPDFLKPEIVEDIRRIYHDLEWVGNNFPVDKKTINKLLYGTNLLTYFSGCAYNQFEPDSKPGLLRRLCPWIEPLKYYQTGVACIQCRLDTIDNLEKLWVRKRMRAVKQRYKNDMSELRESRHHLMRNKIIYPKKLF